MTNVKWLKGKKDAKKKVKKVQLNAEKELPSIGQPSQQMTPKMNFYEL